MLVLRDRLINIPLMSLQTGAQVGVTAQPVIDPRQLIVMAFYCEGSTIGFHPAVLHASDVREYGDLGLIIDSADKIMSPSDLVRLQEVLSFHFQLEGKTVVQEGGGKLGKVVNYTVDTQTFYIMKLHVKPTLLKSFASAELLIDRSQIKSITDKKVVVKRADIRDEYNAKVPRRVENPFRKTAKPQTEAIERQE